METAVSVNRPWQGTVVVVLQSIGLALGAIVALVFIFASGIIAGYLEESPLALIAGFGAVAGIFLIPLLILGFFILRGIYKGQMWAVIVSLVFSGLSLILNLTTFNIVSLLIDAFVIYCLVMCMQNAYYKKS